MKLDEAVKVAVETRDAGMLGRVVDQLRFKCGMNYQACQEFVEKCTGLNADDFETMMCDCD